MRGFDRLTPACGASRGAVNLSPHAMSSDAPTLTAGKIAAFDRDGYVVVRGAFAREDALEMEAAWWAELEEQEREGNFLGYMCGTLAAARVA